MMLSTFRGSELEIVFVMLPPLTIFIILYRLGYLSRKIYL